MDVLGRFAGDVVTEVLLVVSRGRGPDRRRASRRCGSPSTTWRATVPYLIEILRAAKLPRWRRRAVDGAREHDLRPLRRHGPRAPRRAVRALVPARRGSRPPASRTARGSATRCASAATTSVRSRPTSAGETDPVAVPGPDPRAARRGRRRPARGAPSPCERITGLSHGRGRRAARRSRDAERDRRRVGALVGARQGADRRRRARSAGTARRGPASAVLAAGLVLVGARRGRLAGAGVRAGPPDLSALGRGHRRGCRARRASTRALLRALVAAESGGRPDARQPARGARGLLQVMPATARAGGAAPRARRARRRGPLPSRRSNLRLGASYLARLLARYDGDEAVRPRRVQRGPHGRGPLARARAAPARPLDVVLREGYAETRRHVHARAALASRRLSPTDASDGDAASGDRAG